MAEKKEVIENNLFQDLWEKSLDDLTNTTNGHIQNQGTCYWIVAKVLESLVGNSVWDIRGQFEKYIKEANKMGAPEKVNEYVQSFDHVKRNEITEYSLHELFKKGRTSKILLGVTYSCSSDLWYPKGWSAAHAMGLVHNPDGEWYFFDPNNTRLHNTKDEKSLKEEILNAGQLLIGDAKLGRPIIKKIIYMDF